MAVAAAYGVDAPPEELQEIINQVAMNIHGLYVLKSSPEHPEYDPLRLFTDSLFNFLCFIFPPFFYRSNYVFFALGTFLFYGFVSSLSNGPPLFSLH